MEERIEGIKENKGRQDGMKRVEQERGGRIKWKKERYMKGRKCVRKGWGVGQRERMNEKLKPI